MEGWRYPIAYGFVVEGRSCVKLLVGLLEFQGVVEAVEEDGVQLRVQGYE